MKLPQARYTLIIDDGHERCAVHRKSALRMLKKLGTKVSSPPTNLNPTWRLDADQYEDFCAAVPMIQGLTAQDLRTLGERGATTVYIA